MRRPRSGERNRQYRDTNNNNILNIPVCPQDPAPGIQRFNLFSSEPGSTHTLPKERSTGDEAKGVIVGVLSRLPAERSELGKAAR
jgi:hypothetical protein